MPPLTGVAVNVTVEPAQKGLEDATINTPIGNIGFTVITTGFDMAGLPDGHKTFEVNEQVITSPLTGR